LYRLFGYKFLAEEDPDVDEQTSTLILSNDRSLKESIAYFSKFDIINKSTKVSLDKSYRTRTKYYDSIKKELLIFDVESQTSDGSKSIILKGAVNDEKFFEENSTSVYIGKLDSFDDGKGNVHKNYNYSIPQNRQNLDDITKVSCVLTLPSNNFNLYVYQKVPIYFSPQKQTPTIENDFYKRISGDWLITGIEFDHEGGKSHQIVKAIKRELSLLQEEAKDYKTRKDKKQGESNNENNVNELAPGETPAPEPTPNQPNQSTVQPQSTPSVIDRETASQYKLDYILGAEAFRDNNKNIRKLVGLDGVAVDEVVAVAYLKMKEAANKEGIKISITSGFRPAYGPNLTAKTEKGKTIKITTQEYLYNGWIAKKRGFNLAAAPGKSNHGNGIALDLTTGSRKQRSLNSSVYKWLVTNSWKFGFVRAVKTEEWHFEYKPDKAKLGPYALISNSEPNLFFSDLGLNNIKIA
jgi:LAS superfamily LD-carboxypeptidase LdcB